MAYNLTLRIHVDGKRPRGRWWSATVVYCSIEKQWAANLTRERESTLVRLADGAGRPAKVGSLTFLSGSMSVA